MKNIEQRESDSEKSELAQHLSSSENIHIKIQDFSIYIKRSPKPKGFSSDFRKEAEESGGYSTVSYPSSATS